MEAPISTLGSMRRLELVLNNLNISKNDSILEIGLGSGFETFIISKRSKKVVGVDISKHLIELLNKTLQLDNTEFYVMDATKEPPGEFLDAFDKCICLDVVEHVEDPEALLNFIQESLRVRGCLGLSFPINKEHGRNRLTKEDVHDLFKGIDLRANIQIVKQNRFGSFIGNLYSKVKKVLKPSKESDRFENSTRFEMLQHPKKIYWLFKLVIILLFKLSSHTYRNDEYGQRVLIVAQKV